MAKTVQSRKARGRKLQQYVRDLILKTFPELTADDVWSRSMGASGTDVVLSARAMDLMPYGIECKNVEKVALWQSWEQCKDNAFGDRKLQPALFIKRNRTEPIVVLDAEHFMTLVRKAHGQPTA